MRQNVDVSQTYFSTHKLLPIICCAAETDSGALLSLHSGLTLIYYLSHMSIETPTVWCSYSFFCELQVISDFCFT